jgi:septal ring factor EnvC (AmiA/AmiB activator)
MDFSLITVFLAVAETASKPEAAATGTGLSTWWPTLGGLLGVIIASVIGYFNNRPKNQNEQFKVFMDESSEFREEMRKEREAVKAELKEAKAKTESLQFELKACQSRLQNCNEELEEFQHQIEEARRGRI